MSKPFLVLERLDTLAYHMSLGPLPWEKYVNPPSVVSKYTTEYIKHNDQCTTKPLQGPPLDFIHELLHITIDFRQDSPLRLAVKDSPDYFSFCSCLTTNTLPHHPISNQNDYLRIMHTLISLAVVLLLQLWIHNGASNDTQVFHMAHDILMCLQWSTAVPYDYHTMLGPMGNCAMSAFAMVERKSKPFVEYCMNQGIIADGHIQNAVIECLSLCLGGTLTHFTLCLRYVLHFYSLKRH
jgi:hypothetical protein